jgi:hypothetical protein
MHEFLNRRVVGGAAAMAVAGIAAACVLAIAPAAGAGASSTVATSARAKLAVTVRIKHLTVIGREAAANAIATATLTSTQGTKTTARQQVALTAATSGGCEVLHLYLQQLDLNLLGLVAMLDKVNLEIVGHADGGVLGSLFCKLSKGVTGKIAAARMTRTMNTQLAAHSPVLRFSAQLTPQSQPNQSTATTTTPSTTTTTPTTTTTTGSTGTTIAPGSCQVLNLILGPLDLTLLGLEVDLNQIHLDVTANPTGGALGSLFCSLASAKLTAP